MITLRLDDRLEQEVTKVAKSMGLSKSELVRRSIIDYIGRQQKPSSWEAGKDLFGRHSSGRGDLSTTRTHVVKNRIKAKRK